MAAKFLDKILFVISLLLVAGAIWTAGYFSDQAQPVLQRSRQEGKVTAYTPKDVKVDQDPAKTWSAPISQKSGKDWVYEIFTSPYLFLDHGEIVPYAPILIAGQAAFDVAYDGIKPDYFRLQLVGAENGQGIFWNVKERELVVAREGRKLPSIGLEILAFEVKDVPIGPADADGPAATIRVAHATLLDTATNAKIELSSQKKLMTGIPYAILKVTQGPRKGKILDPMKVGTTFEENGNTYRVESVTEDPTPSIVVSRLVQGAVSTTKPLLPKKGADKAKTEKSTAANTSESPWFLQVAAR